MDGLTAAPPDPSIEAVVRALAPVLARIRAEFDTRLVEFEAQLAEGWTAARAQLEHLIDEHRRRAEDAVRESAEAMRMLAGQVTAETTRLPDRIMHQVSLIPRPADGRPGRDGRDGMLTIAHAYVADRSYEPGEVCRHRGGTWQAIDRTAEPPGPEATTWRILADGIAEIDATQDAGDPRVITLAIVQADGLRRELTVRFPVPLHRRGYADDAVYEMGHMVAVEGSTWICLVDRASTPPPSPEWALVAMRGGRGKQGPPGPRGETGPAGRDGAPGRAGIAGERGVSFVGAISPSPGILQLQLDDGTVTEPIDVGTPRFVGPYEPGRTYHRGEYVRFGFHQWLALRTTATVPGAASDDWVLYMQGIEAGAVGGPIQVRGLVYQGVWEVAANNPDLITGTWEAGDYFTCATADPSISEIADPAIPGIGGQSISNGDWIIFDKQGQWDHLSGGGLTRAEADQLYVFKPGDTMTGPLVVQHDPAAHVDIIGDQFSALNLGRNNEPRWILGASHFVQAGYPHGLYVARMSADGSAIVDFPLSIERGNGHLHLGDTEVFGATTQTLIPRTDDELVCKLYVDDAIANADLDQYVRKAGDTMVGDLTIRTDGAASLNLVGGTTSPNAPMTFRIGFGALPGDPGYRFVYRLGGGQTEELGFTLHRDTQGTDAIFMRIPVTEDHVDFRHPRTLTGDPIDDNDLVRKRYLDDLVGNAEFVLRAGDTMTGALVVQQDPIAHIDLFGDQFAALSLGRNGEGRWILGCAHFSQPDYPFGLYFARMSADGSAIVDFPFSIERGNGHLHLGDTEGFGFRTQTLMPRSNDELVCRQYVEQELHYVRTTGDTMTGGLRLTNGALEIDHPADAVLRLGGPDASIISFRRGGPALEPQWWFGVQHRAGTVTQDSVCFIRFTNPGDITSADVPLAISYANGDVIGSRFRTLNPNPVDADELTSKEYVDRLVSGAPHFIGTVNAATGQCSYTPASGFPDGPLIDATLATTGSFLICTAAGNHPSLPGAMEVNDWLITDSNTWTVLHLAIGAVIASNVAVQPPVFGQNNVQDALEFTETEIARVAARFSVWTPGRAYTINDIVIWDGLPFRVIADIAAAPAVPDFNTIRIFGFAQGDYFDGIPTGFVANNWMHLATMPAYGSFRFQFDGWQSGISSSYILEITTSYASGKLTVVSQTHNSNNAQGIFSRFRLSAQGSNENPVRLEGQVRAVGTGVIDFKIIISGFARSNTNVTTVPKPPAGQAANLGGTEYTLLDINMPAGTTDPIATFVAGTMQTKTGGWVRFPHANSAGVDDGRISARLHSAGLNIVGIPTEAGDTHRYISTYGHQIARGTDDYVQFAVVRAAATAPEVQIRTNADNARGNLIFGTGTTEHFHIYRNSGAGGLYFDSVDTAGGTHNTMFIARATGHLEMQAGLRFGSVAQTTPTDLTRHLALWGGATPTATGFGFSVTGGTLNYVVPANNTHDFHCATGATANHVARLNNTEFAMQGARDMRARAFHSTTDNQGIEFFGGGWLYKKSGTGMVLRNSSGNQQPQIEDNNGTNVRAILDTINGDARYRQLAGDVSVTETSRYRWATNSTIAHTNVPFFTGSNANGSLFEWRMGNNNNSTQGWVSLWIGDSGNVLREAFTVNTGNPPVVDYRARPRVNGTPVLTELEVDDVTSPVRLTAACRANPRVRSEGADAGVGNNPPVLRANSNSIHCSNANYPNGGIVHLPLVDYLQHGEAFFFENDATLNMNIQTFRTSTASVIVLTTGNTAVFTNNRRTNLWDYVGTIANAALPPANKVNVLGNSYTMPGNRGSNGDLLVTNGAGAASWSRLVGAGAGNIQNQSNSFETLLSGHGLFCATGSRFYQRFNGAPTIRCGADNAQPQIEDNNGTNQRNILAAGPWENHTASGSFTGTIRFRTRLLGDGTAQIECRMQYATAANVGQAVQLLATALPVGKRPPYTNYNNIGVSQISAANRALIAIEIITTGFMTAVIVATTTPVTAGDPISFNFTYPVV